MTLYIYIYMYIYIIYLTVVSVLRSSRRSRSMSQRVRRIPLSCSRLRYWGGLGDDLQHFPFLFHICSILFPFCLRFVPVLSWFLPQKDLRSQPGSDPILDFRIILQGQQFEFHRVCSGLGWLGSMCRV